MGLEPFDVMLGFAIVLIGVFALLIAAMFIEDLVQGYGAVRAAIVVVAFLALVLTGAVCVRNYRLSGSIVRSSPEPTALSPEAAP